MHESQLLLAAMPLRYLMRDPRTLTETGAGRNGAAVFPMPIDIIEPFLAVPGFGRNGQTTSISQRPGQSDPGGGAALAGLSFTA